MRSTQQFSITLPNQMADAVKADPSRALNIDQVRARLAAEHQDAITKS